jgi:UDP-glucuronate 4-epimerase
MNQRILVTGGAGFIGFHLCRRLLESGWRVVSLDNLNDYYEVSLKEARLKILSDLPGFSFHRIDLADRAAMEAMFQREGLGNGDPIVNLAAQTGVRYARENPDSYVRSNLVGFHNLMELAARARCPHFIYASSSSVYGGNTRLPFAESDNVDHPISLYAATKKSNELMAHVYTYTFGLPTTGLRFFTVYGPWGRPDMALFIFARAIMEGKPVPLFNYGDMKRDFTYIDDIVNPLMKLIDHPPAPDPDWSGNAPRPGRSWLPYRIYNIGNHRPVELREFIHVLEEALGKKAILDLQPMQMGDVPATFADIDDLAADVGFQPVTTIYEGIPRFVEWFRDYYDLRK